MKMFLVCSLLFVVSNLLIAQSAEGGKEEKLQQLKNRVDVKVTEVETGILRLEFPNGKILYKNIADFQQNTNKQLPTTYYSPNYDSTIIDLRYIDTTLYYHKYSFWQEVPIHNWQFDHLMIGDVNKNGKSELYGARKFFETEQEPTTIYELNANGIYDSIYQYDSVNISRNIYDIDKDGKEEVLLTLPFLFLMGNQQRFFSKENDTSLATRLNFILDFEPFQLDDITFGDFDGDEHTDLLFVRNGWPDVHILEYNPIINNFDSVYRFDVSEPPPWENAGFSAGDFDLDGMTDMVFGTMKGNVYVLENEGDNQYTNSWQGSVESYHAYVHTSSNDIDNNGKPEFWVLADAYYNGVGTTRITIFETNSDNSYQAVGRVDLVGIFSFYAGTMQAVDIDNDGTEELAVCIDDNFLILKFNGSRDHHTYELYYIKQNELTTLEEFQIYYGATMCDLRGKDKKEYEILISMIHIIEQPGEDIGRFITKIYKPDSLTVINETNLIIPSSTSLSQNYPNPFNPVTNISYSLPERSQVTLKIYDILGKEVATLVNEVKAARSYKVDFNAEGLTSGIYFYTLTAGNFRETKKMLFLK